MVTFGELGKYGRMGNALFQLSAAIGYAKKHNTEYLFPRWNESVYFNIAPEHFPSFFRYQNKYEEKNFWHEEIPFIPNVSLHGYFQSEKYFTHCKDEIKALLMPKQMPQSLDCCSVHVRRGDYVKLADFHTNLGMDYYFKAMEQIPNAKFLIVFDDPGWCHQHFTGNDFTIKGPGSAIDDFKTLISCTHNIIANSSFSWWGAYLNKNPNKIVVSPKNWFGPKLSHDHPIHDLIPEGWIQC